jgi:hypothetical protein
MAIGAAMTTIALPHQRLMAHHRILDFTVLQRHLMAGHELPLHVKILVEPHWLGVQFQRCGYWTRDHVR